MDCGLPVDGITPASPSYIWPRVRPPPCLRCVFTPARTMCRRSSTLLKIEGPDINAVVIRPQDLPVDWVHLPEVTRDLGTAFLKGKQRVLQVLSAIVPETSNFVFNPMHADAARFRIRASFPYPFEVRLKR